MSIVGRDKVGYEQARCREMEVVVKHFERGRESLIDGQSELHVFRL
jgi:hypothetical protein